MTFIETTEICERSLRRKAANKNVSLVKNGSDYTLVQNGQPIVTVDDDECWALLESM
jgi:hypothetical protein